MSQSPTETIFDFHVAATAPERTHALQERAEYLLDEAAAGVASYQAVEEERPRNQWVGPSRSPVRSALNGSGQTDTQPKEDGGTQTEATARIGPSPGTGTNFGSLRSEISGLLDVAPEQVRVFADEELPAINHRGESAVVAPISLFPQPVQDFSRSQFVDSSQPSRFLNTPTDSAPEMAGSLLAKPAPALGKAPPPAVPTISLTAGQVRFLDEEIGYLYDEVTRVLAARREITGHALSLLHEAREIIFSEPHRLGRAEYNLNQVRSILERAQQSRRESSRRGFRVLLYLTLWLAGSAALGVTLFLYSANLTQVASLLFDSESRLMAHLHSVLWVTITGSVGGVIGAILGFLAHVRLDNDFDRQHVVRFAIQPMMGVVLGLLLYLLFSFFFAFMQIDMTARAVTRAVPVVLALPAGLWQEWIYAFLYRLFSFFTLRPRRR